MKRYLNFITILILISIPSARFAFADVSILDHTFTRRTGKPIIEEYVTFSGANCTATVRLYNGAGDGTFARVSSAMIWIDGAVIFDASNFNQKVGYLEKEVNLCDPGGNETHTLKVLLKGKPGGAVRIVVSHENDYSGTYCLTLEGEGGKQQMSFEVRIEQSGDTIGFTAMGPATVSGTGTAFGNAMTLTAPIGDEEALRMDIEFFADGEMLRGTYGFDTGSEGGSIQGVKRSCWPDDFPAGDPTCILPVTNIDIVTGGQQFNSIHECIVHTGIDFALSDSTRPVIVAPCDGVITLISEHAISEGNIIFDVNITYNNNWNTFIAFEPYSPDPAIADLQRREIAVSLNRVVNQGDLLGRLVVPDDTAFPHIHWGMSRSDTFTSVCGYDYLTPAAQAAINGKYTELGLSPVCLPPPPTCE